MAIVNPGEKLPAAYLERFDPAENVAYRFSVLSTSAIATEHHWVDVASKNIKGVYQCIQGACCHALGRRMQNYNVPIYVYRQVGRVEGDIYVLQMTPARWKKFSDLALQVDLLQYDLTFTASKRGQGLDWTYSILPDAKYRDYWTPEQREQLAIATQSFYQMGESSLVNPMNYNEWNQLLYDIGYDVVNQCWPGGQSPMNAGGAFSAIGKAVGVGSVLPPPPPAGYVASHPQIPNVGGVGNNVSNGVIFQPAPSTPQVASTPYTGSSMQVPSLPSTPPVSMPLAPPQQPIINSGAPSGFPAGSPMVPSSPHGAVLPPHLQQPVTSPVVPLGTAPVVPMASVSQGVSPLASAPVMQNTVPTGTMELTAEELNKLLD